MPRDWLVALPQLLARRTVIHNIRDFIRAVASLGGFLGQSGTDVLLIRDGLWELQIRYSSGDYNIYAFRLNLDGWREWTRLAIDAGPDPPKVRLIADEAWKWIVTEKH